MSSALVGSPPCRFYHRLTKQLGPPLIGLFAARAPLRYIQPTDVAPEKRKTLAITGIAEYVHLLGQDDGYVPTETHQEQQERKRRERKEAFEAKLAEGLKQYNPADDPEVRGDPYKTLFVSRLAYSVTESDLRTVFEPYGAIDRIRLVNEKDTGKPRGYAFIVFEHERDMKSAYKETDGIKIKDRRICVDVERGRTVKNWKPRSLGGGLGGRHYTKPTRRIDTYPHAPSNYSRGPSGPAAGRYTSDRGTERNASSAPRGRSSDRNGRTDTRGVVSAAPSNSAHSRPAERYGAPPAMDTQPRQGRSGIGFEQPAAPAREYRDSRAPNSRYATSSAPPRRDYDRPRSRSRGPASSSYRDRSRERGPAYGTPVGGEVLDPRAAQHAHYQPPINSHAAAPAAPWLAATPAAAAAPSANAYASSRDRYAEQRTARGEHGGQRDRSRDHYGSSRSGRDEWERRSRSRDRSAGGDYKRRRY